MGVELGSLAKLERGGVRVAADMTIADEEDGVAVILLPLLLLLGLVVFAVVVE
jgi:hypothetical protein